MAAAAETTEKAEKKAEKPVVKPLESDPTPKVTAPSSKQQRKLHQIEMLSGRGWVSILGDSAVRYGDSVLAIFHPAPISR